MRKCAVCLKKSGGGNGSFFKVPVDDSERLLWSRSCRTQLRLNDYVCSDHFLRADMICGGSKTILLAKAVPYASTSHSSRSNSMPALQITSSFSLAEPTVQKAEDCQTQTDFTVVESLKEGEICNLNMELTKLKAENRELNYKLNDANALVDNLKKIFTEGQIRKMILPDQNIKWSHTDIANALCLHGAGPKAYDHLYEKGFPLPHASTLMRWNRESRKGHKNKDPLTEATDCMEDISDEI